MTVALDGNNPGGINDSRFTQRQHGYTGPNGRYASFATLTDGVNAMKLLLARNYLVGEGSTPVQIANRWAPVADGNDSDAYAKRIATGLNVSLNHKLTAADALALTLVMARIENAAFPKKWAAEQQRVAALDHGAKAA